MPGEDHEGAALSKFSKYNTQEKLQSLNVKRGRLHEKEFERLNKRCHKWYEDGAYGLEELGELPGARMGRLIDPGKRIHLFDAEKARWVQGVITREIKSRNKDHPSMVAATTVEGGRPIVAPRNAVRDAEGAAGDG